jgi:hypothetical protein
MQSSQRVNKVVAALKALHPAHVNISVAGGANSGVAILAVLDPLSKAAQRAAPILDFLRRTLAPAMQARRSLGPSPSAMKPLPKCCAGKRKEMFKWASFTT